MPRVFRILKYTRVYFNIFKYPLMLRIPTIEAVNVNAGSLLHDEALLE